MTNQSTPPLIPTPPPATKKPKRKKPFNAKKRAKEDLESLGFSVWDVEQTIPYTFIKRDCFGFGDLLAMRPGVGILLVQATAHRHHGNHLRKMMGEDIARYIALWIRSGGRVEIWSYDQSAAQGATDEYFLRRQEIRMSDLPAIPPGA